MQRAALPLFPIIVPAGLKLLGDQKGDEILGKPPAEEYVTFLVNIRLQAGHKLVVRDASGSSDPYVKFKYKGRTCFKSTTIFKNLNPVWDEEFKVVIDDPTSPITLEVYDYDRWAADDYMGGATIDLSQLRLFQVTVMQLKLREEGNPEDMGYVEVRVTVTPLTNTEKEDFMKKATRGVVCERPKRVPTKTTQIWTSVINIVLIEGKNLAFADNSRGTPDPYVKFKLGTEKYKSKPIIRNSNPKWLEQFELHMFDEPQQMLQLMVFDKKTNANIGKCSIDLNKLEKETPNQLLCELDEGAGTILLLISVTGTASTDAVVDLSDFSKNFTNDDVRNAIVEKYSLKRSLFNHRDVGYLTVKVFRARSLASVDMISKSDPYVVVELVNALLQTHTEYKTINPEWNKLFTLAVKDIHSVLEITVYSEDPNKKAEFLGKIAIPLLQIQNGERRWYALKDKKLTDPVKGQILLEMDLIWNPVRAAIRTFNPRESKYIQMEPKFKRRLFMNNYMRLKEFVIYLMQVRDYIQSCFDWDSPLRSILAFLLFVVVVYFFQLYHVPIVILGLFLRPYRIKCSIQHVSARRKNVANTASQSPVGSDEEHEPIDLNAPNSNTSSIRERFNTIQDTLAKVQNEMDFMASLLERVRNTFNFTQPYLSVLAIVSLSVITVLLYFVPLRWIIMAWGINKFTKKLRNPNFIPNNELLDFLSRVPCDNEIAAYKCLPVVEPPEPPHQQPQRSRTITSDTRESK